MIISNVELHWNKLGTKIDQGFDGNSPAWTTEMRTRDKDQSENWKAAGLNVKTKDDEDGLFWACTVKKPTHTKDGRPQVAPPVVGKDKMPFADPDSIGNGTVANIKIHTFDYNYNGREGVGFRLDAIQIIDLVEFSGGKPAVDYFDDVS